MRSFGALSFGLSLLMVSGALVDACSKPAPPVCGDGVVDGDEQCDSPDANVCTQPDAPKGGCRFAYCGDGVKEATEECDDGNDIDWDACTNHCRRPSCQDGIVQGKVSDPTGGFSYGPEECDDGNWDDNDACTNKCKVAVCGDGIVRAKVEACDLGDKNDDKGECKKNCSLKSCGDGIVQPGEECDDGNLSNNDDCLNTCLNATCGDGFLDKAMDSKEECDDGNTSNSDSCLNSCKLAKCGDGYVYAGVEVCDDGMANSDTGDGCTTKCMQAKCGDGLVWAGHEQCDDGILNLHGDCIPGCINAKCGDGILRSQSADPKNNEDCDPGNVNGGDFCDATCKKQCNMGKDNGGGDVLFNGHCYSYFPTKLAWNDANNACLIVGAHLVDIESAAENAAIKGIVQSDSWIALTDQFSTGEYVWYDGPGKVFTLQAYNNYAAGQPTNSANQCEAYGAASQQWSDASCNTAMSYVCEYDYPPDKQGK